MRKTLYLLNIGDYAPELCELTYPTIFTYARRIHAEVDTIEERKFPEWPITYEKLQIYERETVLTREWGEDGWIIYVDSDALIHPELPDVTELFPPDTVAHNGADWGPLRWTADDYFRRDGRNIGSCNWFTVASSQCLDLWRPIEDLTPAEAIARIRVTSPERVFGMRPEHLIDDYALSRNIARYGLKFTTLGDIWTAAGLGTPEFFWHEYLTSLEDKITRARATLDRWAL